MTNKAPVSTPRQIVDKIKRQTEPKYWSEDLRNWYVAEIIDLVGYNLANQKSAIKKEHKDELKWQLEQNTIRCHSYCEQDKKKLVKSIDEGVEKMKNRKFPRGERPWCIECLNRITKDIKEFLKRV